MSRIKVGVRVRPFSVREETMDAKCILAMDNNITLLTNPVCLSIILYSYMKIGYR